MQKKLIKVCRFVLCCLLYKSFCPNISYKYAKIVLGKSPHTFSRAHTGIKLFFFGVFTVCGDRKVMEHMLWVGEVYSCGLVK